MELLFTKEKGNSGRQRELDLAKAIAILFMVWVHVNEVYMLPELEGGFYSRLIEFVGSPPAAPVFMLLLGVGLVYSKNNDAPKLAIRGVKMLILAYALNFIRDFIPYMLLARRYDDISYQTEAWNCLFGIDILQFAGLTFLFFALIKWLKVKEHVLGLILIGLMTANLFLRGITFDSEWANSFFGLFWGTDDYSWFPFLSWIPYPVIGYYFGNLLIRCKDKRRFYTYLLVGSGALSIPLWIYSYLNDVRFGAFGELYQTEYYQHDLMGVLVLGTFAIFWISLMYFVSEHLPQAIYTIAARWSKNINVIYCIHWVLLGYSMMLFEEEAYGPAGVLGIALAVFVLTDCLSTCYMKWKKANRQEKIRDK